MLINKVNINTAMGKNTCKAAPAIDIKSPERRDIRIDCKSRMLGVNSLPRANKRTPSWGARILNIRRRINKSPAVLNRSYELLSRSATNEKISNTTRDEVFPEGKILLNKLDVKKNGSRRRPSAIAAALIVLDSNLF